MRRFKSALLATVAVIGFASIASAADMPTKAPVYKAPVAAPAAFTWTGCYIGAHAGYGWGRNDNDFGGAVFDNDFLPELGPYNHKTSGGVAGGQVGCNYQFQQNWVVGVEGELAWSGLKGSLTTPEDVEGEGPTGFSRFESRNRWNGDLSLRLGYAWDRSLLYGKVGASLGSFRYTEWHDDFPTTHACPNYPAPCSVDINNTRVGLLLGAGWEYAFTNNWSGKIEYNHIDYGTTNIAYPSTATGITSFPVRDRIDVIKVGVNYLFR
jgi:outer membrane immunogenic protein